MGVPHEVNALRVYFMGSGYTLQVLFIIVTLSESRRTAIIKEGFSLLSLTQKNKTKRVLLLRAKPFY